ncbi:MAG: hypothetical protein GY835_26300 [bacterium]|nr:hypothetical protein [bacterium]
MYPLKRITSTVLNLLGLILLLACLSGSALADTQLKYLDSTQWTYNRDCVASTDTLITAMRSGIQFWDVSDPTSPALFAEHYANTLQPWSVDREGDILAYTTDAAPGNLVILDISDPEAPFELASIAGIGTHADIVLHTVADTLYAFTAGKTTFSLNAFNLDDPANPVLRDNLIMSSLSGVAAMGDTLLVTGISSGLHTINIADPGNMELVNTMPLDGQLSKVVTSGNLAAVAANNSGFHVIDISDLSSPILLTTILPTINPEYTDLRVEDVTISGSRICALTVTAGPLVYETQPDPANPVLVAYDHSIDSDQAYPYNAFEGACQYGDMLYASHFSGTSPGALIFDLTETNLSIIGSTQAYDFIRYVTASGDRVYSCVGEMGIFAYELTDDHQLKYLSNELLVEAWGAEARGDTVFVASTSDGLVILDFTDAAAPTIIGSLDLGQARGIEVVDDIAYVVAFTQGIFTVSMTDKTDPVILGNAKVPGMEAIRISVQDTLAVTADRIGGMNLWSVNDPSNITWLGNYLPAITPPDTSSNRVIDVELFGDLAYVAVDREGIHVIDVSDPTLPTLVTTFEKHGTSCVVYEDADDTLLMVTAGNFGLMAYNIATPTDPFLVSTLDTNDNAMALCLSGNNIFIADNASLMAFRWPYVNAINDQVAGYASLLGNFPNPFNPHTNITFDLPEAGIYQLDIFDIRGRRLTTLREGKFPAGLQSVIWQGLDNEGRELPSGVYFARLAGRTASGKQLGSTHKLTLLR